MSRDDRYLIRGPRGYYCVDDRGDVFWDRMPYTWLTREEAEKVVSTYSRSVQRKLHIVEAPGRRQDGSRGPRAVR